MALKKYFVFIVLASLVILSITPLQAKESLSNVYLLNESITEIEKSSGFRFNAFIDFIYIRDKNNINIALTKAKEIYLKPGKYHLSTPLAELGSFTVRKNKFTEIDANDFLQTVVIKNISDKTYLYNFQKQPSFKVGNKIKKNSRALHILFAEQNNPELNFSQETLQLPFGKYRLHLAGQYDNRNYIDFRVKKDTLKVIDFKDHFAYFNIPSDYKRGNIKGIGKKNRYIKCCTVKPGKYTIIVDKQQISEITVEAGKVYDIASRSKMSSVSVKNKANFKITGNGFTHDFSLGNARKVVNLKPNTYELFYSYFEPVSKNRYKKLLTTLDLKDSENLVLDENTYLGKLVLLNKAKTKNTYFNFIEEVSNKIVHTINHLKDEIFLPSGMYRLEIDGNIISNFSIQTGEITSLDLKTIYGEIVLKNPDRGMYNLHSAKNEKYIDQVRTHKRAKNIYLLPGSYCFRERKDRKTLSIGAIIKCFEVTGNGTTVVDLHTE